MEETKTIASDELLAEQLSNRDWDAFWIRLMGRCFWLLRKRYALKWHNNEVKEFSRNAIEEVISKIFIDKVRNWNTDRYPDFEEFIVSVIDSHINNTLNKNVKDTVFGDNGFLFEEKEKSEPSVQEIISIEELRNQIYNELETVGADDNELLIFECLADGIEKPEEIRNEIGLSEEEFHNIWRRFKRKREVIKQKLAAYGY
jgi:hypothetical protein